MSSLYKNDTWKLSELAKGKKAIGFKWVFAKKERSDPDSEIVCYKARFVAKDYTQ